MPYRVDRFNGTFLVTVDDGTIDQTTDLRFIGRNYAGYGEVQNENFLHLLENFANTTEPPKAVSGQIWYDSANKKLKFYDGNQFKTASGAFAGDTAPSGLSAGDFWFDTIGDQLYAYNGAEFVLVGPANTPELSSTVVEEQEVRDTENTPHRILKFLVDGVCVGIISKDEFFLNTTLNPISGFNPPSSKIKKGFTLINTDATTGVTTDDHYYWGTAANSLRLNGRPASDYALIEGLGNFPDAGFTVGDQADLKVYVELGDQPVIENQLGNINPSASITMRIKTGSAELDKKDVAIFTRTAVVPGTDITYDLGSGVSRWKTVFAQSFIGNITGNVTGDIVGVHKGNLLDNTDFLRFDAATGTFYGDFVGGTFTGIFNGNLNGTANNSLALGGAVPSASAIPDTLALRDGSANLVANRFTGTTDQADRLKIDNAATDTDPNYRSAKTTPTANTIAARDSGGNLFAVIFNGTATAAQYADLAEKYLSDKSYEPGTVVIIGGEKEVTASQHGKRALGVVSESPAFMMNMDLVGGTYIALKGRVPVKVIGPVQKGDELVAADDGCAMVGSEKVFAIALENSNQPGVKFIEAVVL